MSNTANFAVGAGSGLALWYLTKPKHETPATPAVPSDTTTVTPAANSTPNAPRNCVVHVDAIGLLVDGARVSVDEAIRRCQAAGSASVALSKDAPAATCVALVTALEAANVPTVRNANNAVSSMFTLVRFPEGIWGKRHARHFRADPPTTWSDAHARLMTAGVIDPVGRARWQLYSDAAHFRGDDAEALPGAPRNSAETFSKFTLALYPEGPGKHKRLYWFEASPSITWEAARDRLVASGFIDLDAAKLGPAFGTWALTTEPRFFNASKAQPLPPAGTRNAGSSDSRHRRRPDQGQPRYTTEGRRILRDGEAIAVVERVDLGDQRFAVSPHEADLLAKRIADLLTRYGAR